MAPRVVAVTTVEVLFMVLMVLVGMGNFIVRRALWPIWRVVVLVGVWALLPPCGQAQKAEKLSPELVNRAITRGVDYLRSKQQANGSWPEHPIFHGGMTALCALSMLSCDVPPDDPRIENALRYLRALEPELTYVVALQTMVFSMATPKKDFRLIERNAQWLMRTRLGEGKWTYGPHQNFHGDTSNTQFALLGLNAAAEAGVAIPPAFWAECRDWWERIQNRAPNPRGQPLGSWGYPDSGSIGSMTVGGISSLVITSRHLSSVRAGVHKGQPVRCKGPKRDEALEAGVAWLSRNFSVQRNPNGDRNRLFYYLYGMERAGRLSGRRFFGDHDWYREGAEFLVLGGGKQNLNGSWSSHAESRDHPVVWDTCFALLFLSKGRIPVLMNKLRFGGGEDWNNAPNDARNLTEFMAKLWNKPLNWQLVDASVAAARPQGVTDLLQAPLLHFCGQESPRFTPKEKRLLREYVEQGGFLIVDANCGVADFDQGFRALCKEIFPEPGQELTRLEPGHAVWNTFFPNLPPTWPLHGINLGCRTAVFYSSDDLSCQWEHRNDPTSLMAFRVGANIVAYAVGPEQLVEKRLDDPKVMERADDPVLRNYLYVAKIRHDGDWNLAPNAIRVLLSSLRDVAKIDVVRQQRDLRLLDPNLMNYPLSYLNGRTRFQLDRKEKDALLEYLRNGGVLFADAACGSEAFDKSFRELMAELLPDKKLEAIPQDHTLYTDNTLYDVRKVTYTKALGGKEAAPTLEGVMLDGRYAVLYSRYDIGCALESQQSTDCKGYVHESALRLASNIVLYALKQ